MKRRKADGIGQEANDKRDRQGRGVGEDEQQVCCAGAAKVWGEAGILPTPGDGT